MKEKSPIKKILENWKSDRLEDIKGLRLNKNYRVNVVFNCVQAVSVW